jgi:hypothetical protein
VNYFTLRRTVTATLRDGVRRLLELNSGTLRWLASRLARRGRLSGDEVAALVRTRRGSQEAGNHRSQRLGDDMIGASK